MSAGWRGVVLWVVESCVGLSMEILFDGIDRNPSFIVFAEDFGSLIKEGTGCERLGEREYFGGGRVTGTVVSSGASSGHLGVIRPDVPVKRPFVKYPKEIFMDLTDVEGELSAGGRVSFFLFSRGA